jgi:hypothetical protein
MGLAYLLANVTEDLVQYRDGVIPEARANDLVRELIRGLIEARKNLNALHSELEAIEESGVDSDSSAKVDVSLVKRHLSVLV